MAVLSKVGTGKTILSISIQSVSEMTTVTFSPFVVITVLLGFSRLEMLLINTKKSFSMKNIGKDVYCMKI